MLTFSVLWVVLSAAVSVLAMAKRSASDAANGGQTQVPARGKESGDAFEFVAIVSCIVLLAGFLYVGRFLVAGL